MEYDRNVFTKECRIGMNVMGWMVLCHLCKLDEFYGDMADATGSLLFHKESPQHQVMVRWMDEVVANQL